MRQPAPITTDEVLEIFRRKTAPAFEVALRVGAALSGASSETQQVIRDYSEALGIAYQIRDDLDDLSQQPRAEAGAAAPSLLLALACDKVKASGADGRNRVMTAWRGARKSTEGQAAFRSLISELAVEDRARAMLDAYKEQAVRTLPSLQHASLKGLLRRVVGKIFRIEIKGWCSEFEARDAAGRQTGAHAAR
jgi:geranylgeranyl pyrophosphate synthase